MVCRKLMGFLAISSLLVSAAAFAGVPSLTLSTAVTAATGDVTVYTMPDGSGQSVDNCMLYGGTVADATITLTLLDLNGDVIEGYPFQDMCLASALGNLSVCAGGSEADGNTNNVGQCTFSNALLGGGTVDYAGGEGTVIEIAGYALTQASIPVYYNSGDLNGDLVVNLSDVSTFSGVLVNGPYAYSCDLAWDGVINLSDVARMAAAWGATCP